MTTSVIVFTFINIFILLVAWISYFIKLPQGNDKNNKKIDFIFCVSITLVIGLFCHLSPFNPTWSTTDSSVFLYIGERMHEGYVPYKDLFDHKGLILYFIQYLGLALTPNSFTGVWILELVHTIAFVIGMFFIVRLFVDDRKIQYLTVASVAVVLGMPLYLGGNLSEEYALPWITLTLYYFLKYFKDYEIRFHEILLAGMGFAVVLFLRVNMVAVWVGIIPVATTHMLRICDFKGLFKCVYAFLMGCLIVCIPIFVYLISTGSLDEMWKYYIDFNLVYTDDQGGLLNWIKSSGIFSLRLISALLLGGIALLKNRKHKLFLINMVALIASLLFATISGRIYNHYGIIILPTLVPMVACGITSMYSWLTMKGTRQTSIPIKDNVIIIICVLSVGISVLVNSKLVLESHTDNVLTCYMKNETTPEDDVLIVGNYVNNYLHAGRATECKYFYTSQQIKASDKLLKEATEEIKRVQPDYIIVPHQRELALQRTDYWGKLCAWLDKLSEDGSYGYQEFDAFYVYKQLKR